MPSLSAIKLSFISGSADLRSIIPQLLFLIIVFVYNFGTDYIKTIPSLFSEIVFLLICVLPPSTINIPSCLPPVNLFSIIKVLIEFCPPRAILALILSVTSFCSI
jgi:hypothetical protein